MDYTGQKIEKYQVKRLIGEGGMASVYEAEHEILGTNAAIKILNPVLSANKQIRERFINEARVMASFEHPNIAKIIDFEENDAFLAIIMEFLEGQDLSDRIEKGPRLTDQEIVSIFEQSLSAFQYAHEKGVVHRDIKPSNIYILPDGKVKILDFGIAKLFGQGNEMTQTGTQMGTPIYMSPEQVKGDKSIDHRSDIYSLGVTLFYALNGKPPYDSENGSQFEIFNKIVYEPLPALIGDSPLIPLVQKACEKDREKRFQSCIEWLTFMTQKKSTFSDIEKTKIDYSNAKDEKITLKVESNSNNQKIENSNYSITNKNKNNKRKVVLILTGLIILIFCIWCVFNFRNKSTDKKNVVESTLNIKDTSNNTDNLNNEDTLRINRQIDSSASQKQSVNNDKIEPAKTEAWFCVEKNRSVVVNGRKIRVADSHYPKKLSYRNIQRVLNDGWRLPTKAELESMYRHDYLDGKGTTGGWRYYLCLSNDKSSFAHYGFFFDPPGEWVIDHAYFENPEYDDSDPSRSHFVKD